MACSWLLVARAGIRLSMVFACLYFSGCASRVETAIPDYRQIPRESKRKVVLVRHGDKMGILDSTDVKQEGITGSLRNTVFVDSNGRDAVTLARIRVKTYRTPPKLKQLTIYLRNGAPAIDSLFGPEETSPSVRRISIDRGDIDHATVYKKRPIFDGRRAGFVMGAGAGPSYISYAFKDDSASYPRENTAGFNFGSYVGIGLTDRVILTAAQSLEFFHGVNGRAEGGFSRMVQSLNLSVYLNDDETAANSSFVTVGTSYSGWAPGKMTRPQGVKGEYGFGWGPGFLAGFGYEFLKHYSVQGNVTYAGNTGKGNVSDFLSPPHQAFSVNSLGFQLVLAAMAY